MLPLLLSNDQLARANLITLPPQRSDRLKV